MSSKHIIHTASITADQMELKHHLLNPTRVRKTVPIGAQAGLTKTGVHFNRVPPNSISTTLHWHHLEDEWCYILEAGKNAVLLLREEGSSVTKEIPIKQGDFIGFPAGVQEGHGLKSDDTDIVYLLGGSRENMDTCHYPEIGRRVVYDRAGGNGFMVEDKVVTDMSR
ncbi:hypothetical protein C8Q75DRAFT_716108 [Abortiporus biennis]|nr:hypothetical protein C8Q75DRAFT_716108 [Abortiporus biennis]